MKNYPMSKFLFCMCILVFPGCRKNDPMGPNTHVVIHVAERWSNAPVAHATVELNQSVSSFPMMGYKLVAAKFTDTNGDATFDVSKVSGPAFHVTCPGYQSSYYVELSDMEKNHSSVVTIDPNAYVKFHIKNLRPSNLYEDIWISSFLDIAHAFGDHIDTVISQEVYYVPEGNNFQVTIRRPPFDSTFSLQKKLTIHDTTGMDLFY